MTDDKSTDYLYWKDQYEKNNEELEALRHDYKKMRDEWEIRLQYSRRGVEVTNRELAKKNHQVNELNKELTELKENLEKKVQERTQELENQKKEMQKKMTQLEKFQRLTTGREIRMKELKEENEKLKQKMEKVKG